MFDLSELVKECEALKAPEKPKYHALERARELQELGLEYVATQLRDRFLLAEKLECIAKEGYPVITPGKIKTFLDRKAAEYNESVVKKHKAPDLRNSGMGTLSNGTINQAFTNMGKQLASDFIFRDISDLQQLQGGTNQWTTTSDSTFVRTEGIRFVDEVPAPRLSDFRSFTNDFLSPATERIAGFAWTEVPVKEYKAIPPDHALKALHNAKAKEIFHYFTIASVNHIKDPLLLGRLNGTEDRYYLAQWGDDVALDDVI